MKKVKVIIPLYREMLPEFELCLLKNNLKVLKSHDIAFVLPEKLALDRLDEQFAIRKYEIIRVSEEWLGKKNGIAGYNKMMMSFDFYNLFSDYQYILLCQTDVFIFRDELNEWCDYGYDYVGAPWPKRKAHSFPIVKQYLNIRRLVFKKKWHYLRQNMFNRIGNGGLSLRKISSFKTACIENKEQIDYFCSRRHRLFNEDVFWALAPQNFRYPSVEVALKFSFDVKPKFCYKLNNNEIPFGCHGLTFHGIYKFWKPILKLDINP